MGELGNSSKVSEFQKLNFAVRIVIRKKFCRGTLNHKASAVSDEFVQELGGSAIWRTYVPADRSENCS